MPKAAIYARYSTDDQSPASIEDQVRQCRLAAKQKGYEVEDDRVFADRAVSGGTGASGKRRAFQELLDAIAAGEVEVLFTDEVSRVAHNQLDGARLIHYVDTIRLRVVVVSDNIDTETDQNWQMLWALKLMVAVHQNQSTAKEVTRGMVGQLERGFMIAQPPIGYIGRRVIAGRESGTVWDIHPDKADIVRRMYEWRHSGLSFNQIATRLNEAGVPCPGAERCEEEAYWRPATVARVLANTIYKGLFVWNGSAFTRAKARRRRKTVETREYPRPHLRLVSDEVWNACNPSYGKERVRGGGKYPLSGIVRCGHCDARLSFGGGPEVTRMKGFQLEPGMSGLHKVREDVYIGALMSPTDVARATASRCTAMYASLKRWTLCGDVAPALFAILRAAGWPGPVAERLTVLRGSAGNYCVITHQLAGFQHRFFAPLYESSICSFVKAVAAGEPLGYSLAGEGEEAVVWASPLDADAFRPVLPLCTEVRLEDAEAVLADYSQALQEVRNPGRIPTLLAEHDVGYASVSALAPKTVLEAAVGRYGIRH